MANNFFEFSQLVNRSFSKLGSLSLSLLFPIILHSTCGVLQINKLGRKTIKRNPYGLLQVVSPVVYTLTNLKGVAGLQDAQLRF